MSSTAALPTAILAIDVVLALPAIYNLFKHGIRHVAILGWAYLFIFFTLRIISSALQLKDATDPSASLVASIGLSPLLLAVVGILHEARAYSIENRRSKIDLIWMLLLHIVISAAVALTAVGTSSMSNGNTTEVEIKKDKTLVTVGMVLLLLSWIYISLLGISSFIGRPRVASAEFRDQKQGKWLVYAVLLTIPFLGIRIITSLVYFTTQNQALNPVTGAIGYKVGLGFIPELITTVTLITAGVLTRNIGNEKSTARLGLEEHGYRK